MRTNLKIRLIDQPYFLFLLTGFFLIITTFFLSGQSVDFHLRDTYFVVSVSYFIWALAGLFFIAWAIYVLTEKFLWTKTLTWTHVLITIIILVLLLTIGFWHDKILPPIKRDSLSYQNIIEDQKREAVIAYPIVTVFILGQIAYFVNLIGGLIKRRL